MSTNFLNYSNNANGVLSAEISANSTGFALQTGQGNKFPTTIHRVTIYSANANTPDEDPNAEIIEIQSRSGDSFTIRFRAREGTPAGEHAAGSKVELLLTAAGIKQMQDSIKALENQEQKNLGDLNDVNTVDADTGEVLTRMPNGGYSFLPVPEAPIPPFYGQNAQNVNPAFYTKQIKFKQELVVPTPEAGYASQMLLNDRPVLIQPDGKVYPLVLGQEIGNSTGGSGSNPPVQQPPNNNPTSNLLDQFDTYGDGSVITNSTMYTVGTFPNSGVNNSTQTSTFWAVYVGQLLASNGWGYSGTPQSVGNKNFFRVRTQNKDILDAEISFKYRSNAFGTNGYTVSSTDAVSVFLRFQSQFWHYQVEFDRQSGAMQLKRKVPAQGWSGPSILDNGGVLYNVKTNSDNPGGANQTAVQYSQAGLSALVKNAVTEYEFKFLSRNLQDGNVLIQAFRKNAGAWVLFGSWTDSAVNDCVASDGLTLAQHITAGHYANVAGLNTIWNTEPIKLKGSSGFRSDNSEIYIDNFQVTPLAPLPVAPPPAQTSQWQDGEIVFTTGGGSLNDWSSESKFVVGSENVVVDLTGGFDGGPALRFTASSGVNGEFGVTKAVQLTQSRVVRGKLRVATNATLTKDQDHTFLHLWDDSNGNNGFGKDLVQIRLVGADNNKFLWQLNAATELQDFSMQMSRKNYFQYNKGQWYDFELYIHDAGFTLFVDGYPLIDWFGNAIVNGAMRYFSFNNVGKNIGGITMGRFYSQNFGGQFWLDSIEVRKKPVAPIAPTTKAEKALRVYQGFKKKFILASGEVVRPAPEGVNGAFQFGYNDVVSEGIGYGLILAVQNNDQATFDAIEAFAQKNLERRLNGLSVFPNGMGWLWDVVNKKVLDWGYANDADVDRALGLKMAFKRWGNTGSLGGTGSFSGTVNYQQSLSRLLDGLIQFNFEVDTPDNRAFFHSNAYGIGGNPFEQNISYHSVGAFAAFNEADIKPNAIWEQGINGSYHSADLSKVATLFNPETGKNEPGVGLVPDWHSYNKDTNSVGTWTNRQVSYGYDAFRWYWRVWWHYKWKTDIRALNHMAAPNSTRAFFKALWNANGKKIPAELYHDGTIKGAYETSLMTISAWCVIMTGQTNDTVGDEIYNMKLANLYNQHYAGDYMGSNPTVIGSLVGTSSYYSDSLMAIWALMDANTFINY